MSRLAPLVPLLGLALLVLFLLLLTLFGTHGPESFRFPLAPGRVYDLILLEKPALREAYSYTIQDQDRQDLDRRAGHYEIQAPNPTGADLGIRLEARPEIRRPHLQEEHLPLLPATPFPQGERTWFPLSESARKLQGGDGASGSTGRIVDFSRGDQPAVVDGSCDATLASVHPEGRALAVVHRAGDSYRLEDWIRQDDGRWVRASSLARLAPPLDPVWDGDDIVFLERRAAGTVLRRWRPAAGTSPEPGIAVAGAYRLLAVNGGLFWLSGPGDGEFLVADETGHEILFRAHPSLQLLRTYLEPQDAFLVRVPALSREGVDLVLRRRLGESSRLIRQLPESILTVSASTDLAVILGVEKCGDPAE